MGWGVLSADIGGMSPQPFNSIQLHAAVALLPGGLHAALEQHPLSLLGAHLLLGLGRIELLCLLVPDGRNGREGAADRQIK